MPVTITATFRRGTARAILIQMPSNEPDTGFEEIRSADENTHWIPMSQILNLDDFRTTLEDNAAGTEITVQLTDWIARQKNLTGAPREVDLERYVVVAANADVWKVVDSSVAEVHSMCVSGNERAAIMIAAALNLTQGKV